MIPNKPTLQVEGLYYSNVTRVNETARAVLYRVTGHRRHFKIWIPISIIPKLDNGLGCLIVPNHIKPIRDEYVQI